MSLTTLRCKTRWSENAGIIEGELLCLLCVGRNRQKFVSCVQINMSDDNLRQYENYFQFHDPITPTLQNRRKATPVSEVMRHDRLVKTEFFNDFLRQDGLCYGMNFFAYDRVDNIGDFRIWRGANRDDFTSREAEIVDAIGPSLVNALIRAKSANDQQSSLRFVKSHKIWG